MTLLLQSRLVGMMLILIIAFQSVLYFNAIASLKNNRIFNRQVSKIIQGVLELKRLTGEYQKNPLNKTLQQWKNKHSFLAYILLISVSDTDEQDALNHIKSNLSYSSDQFFKVLAAEKQANHNTQIKIDSMRSQLNIIVDEMLSDAKVLAHKTQDNLIQKEEKSAQLLAISISLISAMILLIIYWVKKSLLTPIYRLRNHAAFLIQGNYKTRASIFVQDEIVELTQILDELALTVSQKIAEASYDWVWQLDENLNIAYLSEGYEQKTGHRIIDTIGLNFLDLISTSSESAKWTKALSKIKAQQPIKNLEASIDTKNNQIAYVNYFGNPIYDSDGLFRGYRGSATDISKRKLAEIKLSQSLKTIEEQRFILDHHSIVSITDKAGLMIYANDKFSSISGYSNEELIGQNHRLISSGHHPVEFFTDIWQTLSSGNIWQGEICNKAKNGELYWVLSTLAPLFDNSGKIDRYISMRMDITSIKRTEKLLRRSQKMEAIGELTGGIAHDFNNLLGIIIGNIDLIKLKIEDDSKLQKHLNNANKAAYRGTEITRRLLNFSIQSEEPHTPVNISKIINDNEDSIRKSITASINLDIHFTDNIWLVDINLSDFQEALVNLSLNARDAMPSGGTLIFEVNNAVFDHNMLSYHNDLKAGDYVEIMISDSGKGMNKETINKIFDPFFTSKDKSKGTGLGLATVFGFVKRNKGSITVCSKEGLGTTFKIYLPRSKSMTDQLIKPTERNKPLPQGHETVLIVDDEKELVTIAKSVLEGLGYTTICAFSGDEAKEILKNNDTIDIVFSDVVMPGTMNGFDLANAITTTKPKLKILLTSGFTGKIKQKYSSEIWTKNLLSKPYRNLELAEAIRKTLDEKILL